MYAQGVRIWTSLLCHIYVAFLVSVGSTCKGNHDPVPNFDDNAMCTGMVARRLSHGTSTVVRYYTVPWLARVTESYGRPRVGAGQRMGRDGMGTQYSAEITIFPFPREVHTVIYRHVLNVPDERPCLLWCPTISRF